MMMCDNMMSETTDIQMLFEIGHKVYEKSGMIDDITRWISARWEMDYSTAPPSKYWTSLMSALFTDHKLPKKKNKRKQ